MGMRKWGHGVRRLVWRERVDRELDEELRGYIEMEVDEKMRRGMSREEAMRTVRLERGGVEATKEIVHSAAWESHVEALWQDVKFGVRMLRKNPGFTAVAVLTLALGIGANAAIFTVVYGALIRALPFPEPARLLQLGEISKGQIDEMSVTATQLRRLRDFAQPFDALAGFTNKHFNLSAGNETEHLRAMPVSADFLRVLGERPEAGRDFRPEEDAGEGEQVALLSHAVAVRRFGSAAAAVNQAILLDGQPYTTIGVMPPRFSTAVNAFDGGPLFDLWVPMALVAKTAGSGENISVLARMKPGATWAQVTAQTELAKAAFHKEFPGDAGDSDLMSFMPISKLAGFNVRPYLLVLLGATGFVLLIACANVSNLLLARGSARTKEAAVRMAMGASSMRLLRQLLAESMILALGGGALGLALAR